MILEMLSRTPTSTTLRAATSRSAHRPRSPAERRRSTILDVARAAEVSPATVSRVLSGKRVSAALTERVRSAASELRYSPNPAAQTLLLGASPTVGVVVPDLGNPYFAEVLKGISTAAEADDQRTLVADSGEDPAAELRLAREFLRWTPGMVLCSPRMPAAELDLLADEAARLVVINRALRGASTIRVDFAAGMRALCDHLVELGHRHVAYLEGPPRAWSNRERRRALRSYTGARLVVDVIACGAGTTDGHRVADAVIAADATAIIAFSDHVALGVLMRAVERGVRIPEDVSLTGFDDIPMASIAGPGLTTAAVVKSDLGRLAWAQLQTSGPPQRTIVQPRLIVRGSTAPPPAPNRALAHRARR
jgi:LacI family transcriptional regulator